MTTTPHQQPVHGLSGSFWGITTYFNPMHYRIKYENYRIFRSRLKKQALPLVAVELAFADAPFELQPKDADILIQLRTSGNNVLWQKERLINVALEHLPGNCDKIVWLDQDVLFLNDNWVTETALMLQERLVVQPFSLVAGLPKGASPERVDLRKISFGPYDDQKQYGFAYAHASGMASPGHVGYAWAARRSVFDGVGFFDQNILGSGDLVLKDAFYATETELAVKFFPDNLLAAHAAWKARVSSLVQGRVGYIDGELLHLWHGYFKDRRYEERHLSLKRYDFDPERDIVKDGSGVWSWATPKNELHEAVKRYFWMRNEDGSVLRSLLILVYNALNFDDNQRRMHLINLRRRWSQAVGFLFKRGSHHTR